MKPTTLSEANLQDKNVIIRADLDVRMIDNEVADDYRVQTLLNTLNLIIDKGAKKVLLVAHRGRPEGVDENLSLKPICEYIKKISSQDVTFIDHQPFKLFYMVHDAFFRAKTKVSMLENLRFWPEEEKNDQVFADELAYISDVYVNEAFASSHRSHASITALPASIKKEVNKKAVLGLRFEKEIENLGLILDFPKKPVVSIISGIKEDKLSYVDGFKNFSDKVLIAGRLPEYMPETPDDARILVARLIQDKEDITMHSIEQFEHEISAARTIILSGPPGKFEEAGHRQGTERILRAISANTLAFKVAGGGDTERAISTLKLENAFNWISIGGGAMLEFLSKGTLPGLEALLH